MAESSRLTEGLRKIIGTSSEPSIFKVDEGAIQRYAQAIDDHNPVFNDIEYGQNSKYGRLICPPGFTGWPVKGGHPVIDIISAITKADASLKLVDGGVECEFWGQIGVGDILVALAKVTSIIERETKTGKSLFINVSTTFTNQNGSTVLNVVSTFIGL
jgi:acyl dehydratase